MKHIDTLVTATLLILLATSVIVTIVFTVLVIFGAVGTR
jgi:hypothetical protein